MIASESVTKPATNSATANVPTNTTMAKSARDDFEICAIFSSISAAAASDGEH